MNYFDEYPYVIFVDATMDGKPVGTITVTEPRFAADFPNALSVHDVGLKDMIEAVADYLEVPPVWAYEIASFYSMIDQKPVGKHKVNICTNISCWLNGAEDLLSHVENKLGIKLGETTTDNRITLIVEEECLAACCGAPMMVVDGHYHENLDTDKVDKILDGLD